jgi:hypothetical protein
MSMITLYHAPMRRLLPIAALTTTPSFSPRPVGLLAVLALTRTGGWNLDAAARQRRHPLTVCGRSGIGLRARGHRIAGDELRGRSQATAPGRRGEKSIDGLEAARRQIADGRKHTPPRYGRRMALAAALLIAA